MNLSPLTRLELEVVCQRLLSLIPSTLEITRDHPDFVEDLILAELFHRQEIPSPSNDDNDKNVEEGVKEDDKYQEKEMLALGPEQREPFTSVLRLPKDAPTSRIVRILGYLNRLNSDALVYHPEPSPEELAELFKRVDLTQYELVEDFIEVSDED